MVAASKMRKAQDRMRSARPYADKVRNICANLAKANPEYRHEYMVARDEINAVYDEILALVQEDAAEVVDGH